MWRAKSGERRAESGAESIDQDSPFEGGKGDVETKERSPAFCGINSAKIPPQPDQKPITDYRISARTDENLQNSGTGSKVQGSETDFYSNE